MTVHDIWCMAAKNIFRARKKTALTMLSIAIGILSVVIISSIGETGKNIVGAEIDRIGVSGLTLYQKTKSTLSSKNMSADDVARLERVDGVARAMPVVTKFGRCRTLASSEDAVIWGVGRGLAETLNLEILHGRLINASDIGNATRAVVIDSALAQTLFRRENPVGRTLQLSVGLREETFTVCGVIAPQKSGVDALTGGLVPDFVYIPYTAANEMAGEEGVDQIAISCLAAADLEEIGGEVVRVMTRRYGAQGNFRVENMSAYLDGMRGVADLVTLVMSAVAAVSLVVAGISVMSTMTAAVAERRREIGVYMALGASGRDIARCFLMESVILSLAGGILGAMAGMALVWAAQALSGISFALSVRYLLLSELVALTCGVLFGVTPAKSAARLEPIKALRDD